MHLMKFSVENPRHLPPQTNISKRIEQSNNILTENKMRIGKFKILTFIKATSVCCALTFITLVGAGAVEEGTEGSGIWGVTALILSKAFYFFRFPTHTFFFDLLDGSMFFIGLFINCILYGFVAERLISSLKNRQKTI